MKNLMPRRAYKSWQLALKDCERLDAFAAYQK